MNSVYNYEYNKEIKDKLKFRYFHDFRGQFVSEMTLKVVGTFFC